MKVGALRCPIPFFPAPGKSLRTSRAAAENSEALAALVPDPGFVSPSLSDRLFLIFVKRKTRNQSQPGMALLVGSKAPDISLNDEAGNQFSLSSLLGKSVVLYFYPKAGTGGCTLESKGFRDQSAGFVAKDTVIVGISPDKEADQLKFKTDLGLPFKLLADHEHRVAESYGVWKEKIKDGQTSMGVDRTTFLIGPDGVIRHIFTAVNPDGHAEAVLAAV